MLPSHAPLNDLLFMRDLKLGIPSQRVADEALKAFKRHLWYISEELVVLSLFDDRIASSEKAAMVANMTQGGEGQKRRENKNFDPNSDIASFFSCNSRSALDLLLPGQGRSIDYFLSTDPNQWPNDDLYRNFQKQINVIKVVNDTTERGIALISDYNNTAQQKNINFFWLGFFN